MFTVYIDDLEAEIKQRNLKADNTKGSNGQQDNNKHRGQGQAAKALDCLCDWADNWGMSFNLAKCKVMHVGVNNPAYEYTMRGVKLGNTEEERDIGVTVSKTEVGVAPMSSARRYSAT